MAAKFNVSPARQTHDYWRNGATTLFAALNVLDGSVIAHRPCYRGTSVIEQGDPADAAASLKSRSPPRLP
jgi:hypothetical protein